MAGASFTITLEDDDDFAGMLDRIVAFDGEPKRLALADIGEYSLRATRERAAEEVSPDGIPWVPLSTRYAKRKEAKRPGAPLLKFDNHMLGDRFTYQVSGDSVDVGTSAVQGALMQGGGTPDMAPGPAAVPAREWLGASDADVDEMLAILGDHLQASLVG